MYMQNVRTFLLMERFAYIKLKLDDTARSSSFLLGSKSRIRQNCLTVCTENWYTRDRQRFWRHGFVIHYQTLQNIHNLSLGRLKSFSGHSQPHNIKREDLLATFIRQLLELARHETTLGRGRTRNREGG